MWKIVWQYAPALIGLLNAEPADREFLADTAAPHFADIKLTGEIEPVFALHPAVLRTKLFSLYSDVQADPILDLTGYYPLMTRRFVLWLA